MAARQDSDRERPARAVQRLLRTGRKTDHTLGRDGGGSLRTGQLESDQQTDSRVRRALFPLAALAQPMEQHRRIRSAVLRSVQRCRSRSFRWLHCQRRSIQWHRSAGQRTSGGEGNRFPALHSGEFDRLFHGLPEELAETHKLLFQPRLGVAYAINSKTAVRAGLGMFPNRTMINRDTAWAEMLLSNRKRQ